MALIYRQLKYVTGSLRRITPSQIISTRPSSYQSSRFLEDIGQVDRKYEATNDPVDWKYVERILPLSTVPEPIKKDSYPSGWKPQGNNFKDRPYFVARTKNHMIPVYLHIPGIDARGNKRHTMVKHIQGDIWLLEKELTAFLQKQSFKPIRRQVHEFGGYIRYNGDFVNAIKYWLQQREM